MKQELIELCHINDLDEVAAKEFRIDDARRIFVINKQGQFYGYYNVCPHAGWPLNLNPDVFLDTNKEFIQCANHMAAFDIRSGNCSQDHAKAQVWRLPSSKSSKIRFGFKPKRTDTQLQTAQAGAFM